ncbi:TonB-dependent siderophore receptor [Pseudoalteromonas ruthenica]|uniref:TonB-dependent siderophore receptor n=1 Tax=Pseudoalteromonas ruthenica TaxID=151081 RepID=UPI00034B8222|nr:TonB-dependent siderophore receptor [Pseudoalteromonas ruthenica]
MCSFRFSLPFLSLLLSLSSINCALASAKDDTRHIEVLTVTGQKLNNRDYRVESLNSATGLDLNHLDTPQSAIAINQQRMQDQQLTSPVEAIGAVTGISIREADNGKFSIRARGIGVNSILYDGIATTYDTRFNYGDNLTDTAIYERVDVVRGATGLMLGAGNPSAAINLIRKRPTEVAQVNVSASLGSWDYQRATVDASGALSQQGGARGRVVAAYSDRESFQSRFAQSQTTLYGAVETDIGRASLLRVSADYQYTDPEGTMSGGMPIFYSDGSRTQYDRGTSTAQPWSSSKTQALNSVVTFEHHFNSHWQLSASYIYGDNDLEYDVWWVRGNPDRESNEGMVPGSVNFIDAERTQHTGDIELLGQFDWLGQSHQLLVGWNQQKQEFATPYYPAINAPTQVGDFRQDDYAFPAPQWADTAAYGSYGETEQQSAYVAAQLKPTASLSVISGVRLNQWQTDTDNFGRAHDYSLNDELTYYLGLSYALTDNWVVYANSADIFSPQSLIGEQGQYLDPVQGENLELGIKATLFNDKLDVAFSAFQIDQDNVGEYTGETIPGTTQRIYKGIDGTRTKGVELELNGAITENWQVYLGYTHAEGETPEGEILNSTNPEDQIKVFSTYNFSGALAGLTLGGGINWQSETFDEVSNPVTGPVEVGQGGYGIANIMARYAVSEQLTFSINLDNLFDKRYYNQIGFYDQYRYGAPRNFKASVRYQF